MPFRKSPKNDSQDPRYDDEYYGRQSDERQGEDFSYDREEEKREETRTDRRRPAFSGATYSLKLMKPTAYSDGTAIADELTANNAVIINLENADAEVAANLIFFLDGVIYAIGGHLKPVSANTFMLAPGNMEITEAGFAGHEDESEPEEEPRGSEYGYQGYGSGFRG